MRKILLSIILYTILFYPIKAQDNLGTIRGKITNDKGESLIGINIGLKNTSYGSATDVDGVYFINNIPAGKYTLVVSAVGFQIVTKEINLTGRGSSVLNFKLKEKRENLY